MALGLDGAGSWAPPGLVPESKLSAFASAALAHDAPFKTPFVNGGVRRPVLFTCGQPSAPPPWMPFNATDDRLRTVDRSVTYTPILVKRTTDGLQETSRQTCWGRKLAGMSACWAGLVRRQPGAGRRVTKARGTGNVPRGTLGSPGGTRQAFTYVPRGTLAVSRWRVISSMFRAEHSACGPVHGGITNVPRGTFAQPGWRVITPMFRAEHWVRQKGGRASPMFRAEHSGSLMEERASPMFRAEHWLAWH